jgi:uncharacterized protein YfcZ (UPF0381/DUF406 family)
MFSAVLGGIGRLALPKSQQSVSDEKEDMENKLAELKNHYREWRTRPERVERGISPILQLEDLIDLDLAMVFQLRQNKKEVEAEYKAEHEAEKLQLVRDKEELARSLKRVTADKHQYECQLAWVALTARAVQRDIDRLGEHHSEVHEGLMNFLKEAEGIGRASVGGAQEYKRPADDGGLGESSDFGDFSDNDGCSSEHGSSGTDNSGDTNKHVDTDSSGNATPSVKGTAVDILSPETEPNAAEVEPR